MKQLWTDEAIDDLLANTVTNHEAITVDTLRRWVDAMSATQAKRLLRRLRDEYEDRIRGSNTRIAALEQEVAMLKAHNGLISAELGRTKQRLFDVSN